MNRNIITFLFSVSFINSYSDERPNIIVILSDDMGYSDLGCFGSEIRTPNLDSLAINGLRFTQFYNCGRSCPTRASLMTGLYPHQAGIGEMMNDFNLRGYRGTLSENCLTIAEVLKEAGYCTYMSGKWHVTNVPYGDGMDKCTKINWPLQRGFERFYGTLHGAGSYWDPSALVRDNEFISPYTDDEYKYEGDYYYTNAISDNAVRYIKEHDSKKPFFLYVAYTAPHWPMHAPKEVIDTYNGVYDKGYDYIRSSRIKKMYELGIIDNEWKSSFTVGDWSLETDKEWRQKLMQTYASMITIMDSGIGKIISELKRTEQLDNTLILFMQDNGGSSELRGEKSSVRNLELIDRGKEWYQNYGREVTRDGRIIKTGKNVLPGADDTFFSYGKEWANVSNTPFREYKKYVHEGGISSPLIAFWPNEIKSKSELRTFPSHVIDIMATCIDIANADYPKSYKGKEILPLEGRSLLPIFKKDKFNSNRKLFFEHMGNCALRKGDWKLVGKGMFSGNKLNDKGWELYNIKNDRCEMADLSEKYPEKVKEMMHDFLNESKRLFVLPKR